MAQISVSVVGDIANDLKRINLKMTLGLNRALLEAALMVRGTVIQEIQQGRTRTGNENRRTGRGRRSAKRQFPKSDTGALARSIKIEHSFLSQEVGSDLKYAAYLEGGTDNMDERPFLQPSYDLNKKLIEKKISKALMKAFK